MTIADTDLVTAEKFAELMRAMPFTQAELVAGKIVVLPITGVQHGCTCANVAFYLSNFAVGKRRGYVCTNGVGYLIKRNPDTVRAVDVVYYDDDDLRDKEDGGWDTTPPTIAVIVVDLDDPADEVELRKVEHVQFGTPLVWVVDPNARTVVIARPGREDRLLTENDWITGEDVLLDFRCRVGDFFEIPGRRSGK